MNPNPSDLECRVCREGPDEAHPLYFPCMCSGSIGAVHQSCLEEWLDVSKKDTCELCLTKYRFEAHYADGMPDKVSLYLFAKSVLKMFLVQVLPFILRVMIALVIWVLIVPVLTTCIYSVCVGRSTVVPIEMSWNAVRAHVVHGFNIDAVIAMSLLILVSFTDFLRFHLVPNPPDGALAAVPNGMPAVVVEPAPNAAPVGEGRANAINAPAQVAAGAGAAEGNPQQHRQERARRPRRAQGAAAGAGVNDFGAQRRRQGRDTKRGSGNDRGAHAADADDQAGAAPETAPPATPAPAPAAPRMYRREDNPFYRPPTPTPVAAETLRQQAGGGGGRRTPGIAWDQPDDQPEHSPDIAGGEDGNTDDHGDHGDDDVPDLQSDSESSWETVSDDEGGDNGDAVDVEQVDAVRERVALNLLNQVQGEAAVNNAAGPAADNDIFGVDGFGALDDNVNAAEAGVEIRLALFEILGVEGPFHLMFRNSFWLLIFCGMYLFFTAMVPYIIGKLVLQVVVAYTALPSLLPGKVVALLESIQRHSTVLVPLQFLDFFYVSAGLSGIFCAVFVLDGIATVLKRLKLPNAVKTVLELVGKLAVVIKVGTLLLVRIFLLPLCLGTVIVTVAAHTVLEYSTEQWGAFVATHCLGAFAVAWVSGITFMLVMTISVLQLREVLHPRIFGKLIRPQEPHLDLIQSLINEGGAVHIRRIAVSLLVYILLMGVMIYLPMLQLRLTCHLLGVTPFFHFHYWYVLPEIQIPLEIMVGHIVFLSVLDKHKDVIGHGQHVVLVYLADKLGLTRFLIPLSTLGRRGGSGNTINRACEAVTVAGAAPGGAEGGTGTTAQAGDGRGGGGAAEGVRVGAPLQRPPPGWDIRTPNQSSRWAWGSEQPSPTERNVAPQLVPKYWLFRTVLLVLICTLIINGITLFLMAVPLPLGRALMKLIGAPQFLYHDPLHFVVGCVVCATSARTVHQRAPPLSKLKLAWKIFTEVETPLVSHVLVTWAYIIAALTCVAILIATLTYPPQQLFLLHLYDSAAPQEASVGARFTEIMSKFGRPEVYWKIAQYYALSCVVSYFAHSLLISQAVTSFLAAPQRRQDPALEAINQWILNMRDLPKHTLNAIVNYQFTAHQMRLQSIQAHVLYPFVHEIGVKCIIYSAVAAVIAVTAFFRVNTTVELVGSAFQQCVYLYLIRRAYLVAHTPVKEVLDALNQQVLNDNYLIGRTLVNNHPQPDPHRHRDTELGYINKILKGRSNKIQNRVRKPDKGLAESLPKVLFSPAPTMHWVPYRKADVPQYPHYKCPVYKTSDRRGILATTGHSNNFVCFILMPSERSENHWVERGVAMLTQLDD